MNPSAYRGRLDQLGGLVELATRARRRASAELDEARVTLAEAERVRDEQIGLIEDLRRTLGELGQSREGERGGAVSLTAGALVLETQRRRWLLYDIEKESFYLGTMRSDVARARKAVAESAGRWRACMARLDKLDALGDELRGGLAKREARRSDALADEIASVRVMTAGRP